MKLLCISVLALALVASAVAKDKKKSEEDPVVWGMLGAHSGCVIFKESRKAKDPRFYGVVVTAKIVGVLDVIETKNYQVTQKRWLEDQEGMNQLQRIGVDEQLKFIKIQENYSPALLDKARSLCAESLRPPAEPDPGPDSDAPALRRRQEP